MSFSVYREKPHLVLQDSDRVAWHFCLGPLLLLLLHGVWYCGDRTAWGRWWRDWNLHEFSLKPKILPLFLILILFKLIQTNLNRFKLLDLIKTCLNWLDLVETGLNHSELVVSGQNHLELVGSDRNWFEPIRTVSNLSNSWNLSEAVRNGQI